VIEDKDHTTYTVTRNVSAPELKYIQDNVTEGLSVMIDALKFLPKKKV
jgi:hypothetical protein